MVNAWDKAVKAPPETNLFIRGEVEEKWRICWEYRTKSNGASRERGR